MTCYHPLKRWVVGFEAIKNNNDNLETKSIAKITPYKTEYVKKPDGTIQKKFTEIPCGKCIGCRIEKTEEWATRIMLEAKYHENNHVLTLTYDDENIPKIKGIDPKTGEFGIVLTLKKKDVQNFNKRLRMAILRRDGTQKIKFFASGEYGEQYGRPHYHIIYYNLPINDLKEERINKKGNIQNISKEIEKIWGKGRVTEMPLNYETARYVARYVQKKLRTKQETEALDEFGRQREFQLQSQGMALEYFKKEILPDETKKIWVQTKKALKQAKMPRYMLKKLEEFDEERYLKEKSIKEENQELRIQRILKDTGMTREQYLEHKEYLAERKLRVQTRNYENGTK